MFRNYIKVALRNLFRNKIYSLINILGLAVGLAATILLFLYVRLELSYDKHFKEHEQIYRVLSHSTRAGEQEIDMPITLYEIPEEVTSKIPEVAYATRTTTFDKREVKVNGETKGFYNSTLADSSFFKVFSFKSYAGDLQNALDRPNSVVLTKESAEKIFGNADAVGKTVYVFGDDMTVTAVMENVPENTHLKFDLLISIISGDEQHMKYQGNNFHVYVKFKQPATDNLRLKTCNSISAYVNEMFKEYKITYSHSLQPLADIHLHSGKLDYDSAELGSIQYIYIFSILAAFILIIAIFNYVSLFTAKSESRAKEVGIRKVSGAFRHAIVKQFIGESVIISFISFLIAMFLVEAFLPHFGNLVSRKIVFSYAQNFELIGLFLFISLFVGFFSGIYPALFISRFNPVAILKGTFTGKKNKFLNILLVVVQFSIAIALISSLFVLYAQVRYMKNKNMGFDKEQLVVFSNFTGKIVSNYESLKGELLSNPDIISVTASQSIPGISRSGMNIRLPEWPLEEAIPLKENRVQDDYVKTMGFELIEGSDFSDRLASDSAAFILNEAAARLLNLDDPIGKEIIVWLHKGRIKGIIKDFHFTSLHEKIEPLVFSHYSNRFHNISIRIKAGRIPEGLKYAQGVFSKFDADYTQNYTFLDDMFDSMYRNEEKSNKLIFLASLLAILISVMGLLALTSFVVARRTKEIGIRKALGSNVGLILVLLNKDILKWVFISSLIGIPASYLFMKKWLLNFAYRIDLNIGFFLLALLIAILIAVVTITVQSFKTANKNPTESLRYE
ncbi:MAG: ABC transporter permease [Bacteroidetes bacterium]|nr:ABC transporter permease [Bacteroidota bacterium]